MTRVEMTRGRGDSGAEITGVDVTRGRGGSGAGVSVNLITD